MNNYTKNYRSMGVPIWGKDVPYNTGRSKLDDMEVHPEYSMLDMYLKHPGIFSRSKDGIVKDMTGNDTLVFKTEIDPGYASENYDDIPYIVPYIVEGSDRCIISVPGGGYLNKSMDNEGEHIAEFLNEAGISCFVLWYRSYPYRAPTPWLDLQRAIRYVRAHSDEYGIDPRKIGIVGFSAGGNCCGMVANVLRNKPVEVEDYIPDDIDAVSADIALAGMIYAATNIKLSPAFLNAMLPKEMLKDKKTIAKLAEEYDSANYVDSNCAPQFVCYAKNDLTVPVPGMAGYYDTLVKNGVKCERLVLRSGGHGFGGCKQGTKRRNRIAGVWKKAFSDWANGIFDSIE